MPLSAAAMLLPHGAAMSMPLWKCLVAQLGSYGSNG